jgi:hypothetical protein
MLWQAKVWYSTKLRPKLLWRAKFWLDNLWRVSYMTLFVNMIPYMKRKFFSSLDDTRCIFFALYDSLLHYITYKNTTTPSAMCDKNQRNFT